MPSTSFTYTEELKSKIKPLLVGSQTISQFAHNATEEKVNRMETRDERSRLNLMKRDVDALKPVVGELFKALMESPEWRDKFWRND